MNAWSSILVSLLVLTLGWLAMFSAVKLILRVLTWARRRRAEAAAMMTGQYLASVAGGQLPPPDWDFTDWLGQQLDDWLGHAHPATGHEHGTSASLDSGPSLDCSHDAGGVCGHGHS